MTARPIRVAVPSSFRYPGSKEKIADEVIGRFPGRVARGTASGYCEPFVGSGAVAMRIARLLPDDARVVFGDTDPGIVGYWRAVHSAHEALIARLCEYTPTVDSFYRLKELDGTPTGDPVEDGFRKFVLHQISFSGLGARAGGPIGGRGQRSRYGVGCRYDPNRHAAVIALQHRALARFRRFEVICGDFEESLGRLDAGGFAYLDPPYYLQGEALYAHAMSPDDHRRLAGVLRAASYAWTLSYDDHPDVREMYSWATVESFEMVATIDTRRGTGDRRRVGELVIRPTGVPQT